MLNFYVQSGQTSACYDADFFPYGGEKAYTSTCPQNYKFEGKERDAETGNDDFGARYYSSVYGRWLSPDWSAVPAPVPYANLTNPQTLNLYAMVCDNPESFADLDGHDRWVVGGTDNQCGNMNSPCPTSFFELDTQNVNAQANNGTNSASPSDQKPDPQKDPGQQQKGGTPAPTNPDGTPAKPPVPPPPGKDGKPNDWVRTPGKDGKPDQWDPRDNVPSPKGGQPRARWDEKNGHWDIDDGNRNRTRYLPDGTKVDHNNRPIPFSILGRVAAYGTAAVVTYWIISEGSRILFPVRNLVPVP